jgi:hypothetical protein
MAGDRVTMVMCRPCGTKDMDVGICKLEGEVPAVRGVGRNGRLYVRSGGKLDGRRIEPASSARLKPTRPIFADVR